MATEVEHARARHDSTNHSVTTPGNEMSLDVASTIKAADAILKEAATVPETESRTAVQYKAQVSTVASMSDDLLKEEREDGRLELRPKQAVIHLSLTEQRLSDVERELRYVRQQIGDLPEDFEPWSKKLKQHFVYRHELQRSTASQFRLSEESFKSLASERAALEVLLSENVDSSASNSGPCMTDTTESLTTPQQLRIRYRPLISHLQRITRVHITNDTNAPERREEPKQSAVVFLRPFKLFVTHEKEIRRSLDDMRSQMRNASEKGLDKAVNKIQEAGARSEFYSQDLLTDLGLLVKFFDEDLRSTFELRSSIEAGENAKIEYPDLWHLFQRGDIVVSQDDVYTAYRVLSFTGGRDTLIEVLEDEEGEEKRKPKALEGFTLDCISIVSDGNKFVPSLRKFVIRRFVGKQQITALSVFPLKCHPDAKEICQQGQVDGNAYLDVTSTPYEHRVMSGKTLNEPMIDIEGQVIVDMAMAYSMGSFPRPATRVAEDSLTVPDRRETSIPTFCKHTRWVEGCCGTDIAHKDLDMDQLGLFHYLQRSSGELVGRKASDLNEEDQLLLAKTVYAFTLRSRRWVHTKTCDLKPVTFGKNFDKDLLIPQEQKNTIRSLVRTHEGVSKNTKTKKVSIGNGLDLVKGKGTGIIFLLHGEPGTGKTLTAECVADDTKRPLFPITCGDIGETAPEVEENLQRNFNMAQKWRCVLLLDEADVFLNKRGKTDLRRNAVVSVFLRSLEYYSGILFLTTNRVGTIDPAFKSRIHMSLLYPALGKDESLKLYRTFIKRAKTEQEIVGVQSFKINKNEILDFARGHFKESKKLKFGTWNGRQIRNAFQAAIALVENESEERRDGSVPTLGRSQFDTVAQTSREFERYLVDTLHGTEADIAHREGYRAGWYPNPQLMQQPPPVLAGKGKKKLSKRRVDDTSDLGSDSDDDDDDDRDSDEVDSDDD